MENEFAIIDIFRLFVGSYSIYLSYKGFYFKNASKKVLFNVMPADINLKITCLMLAMVKTLHFL